MLHPGASSLTLQTMKATLLTILLSTVLLPLSSSAWSMDGLLGYWRLDEGTGEVATDSSGNGNDGAIAEAADAWITDPDRGSVYQSGNGSFIDFGTFLPVINLEQDFTWSFWVFPNETDNNNIVFGNRWSPDGSDFSPREFIKFTPRVFEWHFDGGGENVTGGDTLFVTEEWSHNLVVKSGNTLTYYRNGEELASSEITAAPINEQPLYLGGQESRENFSGLFDEVAVFDRALAPSEVIEVFELGEAGSSLSEGGDDPNITISSKFDLGQVAAVPTQHPGQFKVRNTGATNTLTLSKIEVTGSDADHFSITSEQTATIAAGSDILVDFLFDSKGQTGGFFAQFNLTSDDASDPLRSIEVAASIINLQGPIAHYRFDEAAGSEVVRDSTGFGRAGTLAAGNGSVSPGAEGLAGGQAVAVTNGGLARIEATEFDSLEDFTITLWASQNTLTGDLQTLVGRGFGSPSFALLVSNGDLLWLQGSDAEPLIATSGGLIQAATAHHITMLADSSAGTRRIAIYVDGVEAATLASPDRIPDEPDTPLYIGAFDHALGFTGRIDDVQIYDRALSDSDIKSIFNNPGATLSETKEVDSDGDGLSDVRESELGTDPLRTDSDGDGLTDGAELNTHNTSPTNRDTDGDGANDRFELNVGTDPNDDASVPKVSTVDGLLGYWRFEEGQGNAATDLSGNGNDGEIIAPDDAWVTDPTRGTVYQSGSDSYIEFGEILPVLDLEQDFTWSFWVNPGETDNNNIVFGNRYSPDGADFAPREFIKFTPRVFEWHVDGGGQNVPGDNTMLEVDVWSHNLVVKSGANLTYYRNGEEVATHEITSGPANPQPLYLGGQNGVEVFTGLFDEVAIFDRALSEEEVVSIFQTGDNGGSLIEDNGGNPGDGGRDADRDGVSDANEAIAGTDPSDATNYLHVTSTLSTDAGFVIEWQSTPAKGYRVQFSSDLISWETISDTQRGEFPQSFYADTDKDRGVNGYYRVETDEGIIWD